MITIEQKALTVEFWRIYKGESFRNHLTEYLESAIESGIMELDARRIDETARLIFHAAILAYARPAGPVAEEIQQTRKKQFLFV
jgi:hypothetical protein